MQVWQLILCVNLTQLRGAQIAGKASFLGVSERMFFKEISLWVSRLSEEDGPGQCGPAFPNLLRAWLEQKDRKREFAVFVELGPATSPALEYPCSRFLTFGLGRELTPLYAPPFLLLPYSQPFGLGTYTIGSCVLWLLDSGWITPLAARFSSSWRADHGTSQPS